MGDGDLGFKCFSWTLISGRSKANLVRSINRRDRCGEFCRGRGSKGEDRRRSFGSGSLVDSYYIGRS